MAPTRKKFGSFRQWKDKHVSKIIDGGESDSRWEMHCEGCHEVALFDGEQDAVESLTSHKCANA